MLTSGREEPVLWHAASACQLGPKVGMEKGVEMGITAHRAALQHGEYPVHPIQGTLCPPFPSAESSHYVPDTTFRNGVIGQEIRTGIPGQEINVSSLAITFLFLVQWPKFAFT